MTKPSLHQQILPIESPSAGIEYERFFVQIDNKIGSVKLNIHSRYKLKEVYKLNQSSKLFKLKEKKDKKKQKYGTKCFSRKIIRTATSYDRKAKYFVFLLDA